MSPQFILCRGPTSMQLFVPQLRKFRFFNSAFSLSSIPSRMDVSLVVMTSGDTLCIDVLFSNMYEVHRFLHENRNRKQNACEYSNGLW